MPINGAAVLAASAGALIIYSGVKGKSVSATAKSFISGQNPASVAPSTSNDVATLTAASGPIVTSGSVATNQNIARMLAAPYGWSTGAQWDALVQLWQRESSWSNTANNPSSGAYGIAQALPPTKYPLSGQPESLGGSSSASTQIAWGLAYIAGRYGNPVNAWAHETSAGWY